jgi:hypothetical protein
MIGKFKQAEKPRQVEFKDTAPYFSDAARVEGYYKGHPYTFCLPVEHAEENLFPEIREPMMEYFAKHEIKWHDGHEGKPGTHMCDSQVCCANFLFPFFDKPEDLAALLRPVYPELGEMCTIEDDQYVACEWVGLDDYLGEISKNGKHTRGALFTSADAVVMFRRADGKKQIALIE